MATPLSGGSDRTGGFASNVPSFGDVPDESVVRICVDQVEVAAGRLPHDRSAAADVRDIAEHLDVIRGVGAADPDPLRVQFSVAFDTIQCCTGQAGGDTAMDQLTFGARGGRLEDALPFVLDRVDLIGARSVNMSTHRSIGAAPLDAEGRRSAGHGAVPWI